MTRDVMLPDIGDFKEVPVVEIPVAVGDRLAAESTILVLESEKATLDIPAPFGGTVVEIFVSEGDLLSEGSLVLRMETELDAAEATFEAAPQAAPNANCGENHTQMLVIGAGPGGYTAAFRTADLGREVTLVDPRATLGGVCLNVGCIPSKALLHLAKVRDEADEAAAHGLKFAAPDVNLDGVRDFKNGVIAKLTGGLTALAKKRKVRVIRGTATFSGAHSVEITDADGSIQNLTFDQAIVAVGSEPVWLPFLPDDPRIIDSTGALELESIPERLLVIGGGIIGLEMAQIYDSFGAHVEIVELANQIIPGADKDVIAPLAERISKSYGAVRTGSKVTSVLAGDKLVVSFECAEGVETAEYDRILVAVGRTPNGAKVAPGVAGIVVEGPGFLPVNAQMQTSQPHIFAIGDVVGQPMLAHKATHQAKVAAEAAADFKVTFEPACIPSVAYTDPEVAWVGLTETEAKIRGIKLKRGGFPWMASGRALSLVRDEGATKLLFDDATGKVVGGAIVGPGAGELIAEVALAIEMGADAHDIGMTIHPHPTLSETVGFAAEAFLGTLTDL